MDWDVFNGDADGICAIHQLRLAEPREATLITGVKRDVALLARVQAGPGDRVSVCDIAVSANRPALEAALAAGARVAWFDHHDPGPPLLHPGFEPHLDTASTVCSSLLVDRHLGGRHRAWAVVAAFGDNLHGPARDAAAVLNLAAGELELLRDLGECLNYNAYGETVDDLHLHPEALYRRLAPYADPLAFARDDACHRELAAARDADLALADRLAPEREHPGGAVHLLPDAAWARRVSGILANRLAHARPDRAHAVLSPAPGGGWRVSVRSPLDRPAGAGDLCKAFPGGGGRAGAGGINRLAEDDLPRFLDAFARAWR